MVKAAADPGFDSRLRRWDFSDRVLSVTSKLATLPGVWRYRVSAGADRPGVSIL